MTKLLENIFRSVNIALVNELAMLCDRMGIDVWEVIDAAATKPFGFMQFQPGPGPRRSLHPDRPVLPLVEGARVRLLDRVHRAGRQGQREHAVLLRRQARAERSTRASKASTAAALLVLGVAYKPTSTTLRESPALQGHRTAASSRAPTSSYHDPHVPSSRSFGLESVELDRGDASAATTSSSS